VPHIYENMFVTDRMLDLLEADPNFRINTLQDPSAEIPMIAWRLWVRAPNNSGQLEIVKGPHYQRSFVRIDEAAKWPSGSNLTFGARA
jgi:hypothetical protein